MPEGITCLWAVRPGKVGGSSKIRPFRMSHISVYVVNVVTINCYIHIHKYFISYMHIIYIET